LTYEIKPDTEWPDTEWPGTEWPDTEWPGTEWPDSEWPGMNIYWNDTNNTTHTIVKYNNYKTLPSNKYNNKNMQWRTGRDTSCTI
jgi:hypothetical protein